MHYVYINPKKSTIDCFAIKYQTIQWSTWLNSLTESLKAYIRRIKKDVIQKPFISRPPSPQTKLPQHFKIILHKTFLWLAQLHTWCKNNLLQVSYVDISKVSQGVKLQRANDNHYIKNMNYFLFPALLCFVPCKTRVAH